MSYKFNPFTGKFDLAGGGAASGSLTVATDTGTSPVVALGDTLTITSSDGSIAVDGDSGTDTIDLSITGAFEIAETAPYITLHNTTEEDTDGGRECKIIAVGEQSGGENSTLGEIEFSHDGTSDDEQGKFILRLNDGNDGSSPTDVITAFSDGQVNIGDYGVESGGINVNGTTYTTALRVNDIGGSKVAQMIIHRHSTTLAPIIVGARTNSNTSSHSAVTAGQETLSLYGVGYTGSHYDIFGQIDIEVDSSGTISATSSPGRITFSTTPDGSNSPVARMTMKEHGRIGIGSTTDGLAPVFDLHIDRANAGGSPDFFGAVSFGLSEAGNIFMGMATRATTGPLLFWDDGNDLRMGTAGSSTSNPDASFTDILRITSTENVIIGASSTGTNAQRALAIAIGTEPTTSPAGQIAFYAKDSSDGTTNATLGLRTEQSVETIGTFTASHKLKIWINGTEYWVQLDAV